MKKVVVLGGFQTSILKYMPAIPYCLMNTYKTKVFANISQS